MLYQKLNLHFNAISFCHKFSQYPKVCLSNKSYAFIELQIIKKMTHLNTRLTTTCSLQPMLLVIYYWESNNVQHVHCIKYYKMIFFFFLTKAVDLYLLMRNLWNNVQNNTNIFITQNTTSSRTNTNQLSQKKVLLSQHKAMNRLPSDSSTVRL